MINSIALGSVVIAGLGLGVAFAQSYVPPTASAWGHVFDVSPFEAKTMSVAVVTDKRTHKHMNVVKLKNGHMMALVPADSYLAMMADDDKEWMVE